MVGAARLYLDPKLHHGWSRCAISAIDDPTFIHYTSLEFSGASDRGLVHMDQRVCSTFEAGQENLDPSS